MGEILNSKQRRAGITLSCVGDKIRTKQDAKDETDINRIMAKFRRTGVVDFVKNVMPKFADVTAVSFEGAMATVVAGREAFQAMPAELRAKFKNDPVTFLEWCEDPANRAEGVKLGLWPADSAPEAPAFAPGLAAGGPAGSAPAPAGAGSGAPVQ